MALVKYNNNSLSSVTSAPNFPAGAMTLISTTTASSDSTISITSGIDSTYPIYVFKFISVHPSADNVHFRVNFRDGGSSYDATKTTNYFRAYADEADSSTSLAYSGGNDLANGTGVQNLTEGQGNGNDESFSGEMFLFDPSSTTFVKHFISRLQSYNQADISYESYVAGYCNVTAAIDGVQFDMTSGNIDAGTIKLYGIKDS